MDKREKALANAPDWIAQRWKAGDNTPCPMCGTNNWAIAEPVAMQAYAAIMGGAAPFVAVVCQHCGATQFMPINPVGAYPGLAGD
jgi:predicted nucleic-acid-binding Zn-ribbon protein